jgi:regulatory protein
VRRKRGPLRRDRTADLPAAYAAAVASLARRDLASAELRERLERQGFDPSVVAAALAMLMDEHVLDDARFANHYVAHHAERGQGPLRIAASLTARGLSTELVEAALKGGPDWRTLACEVSRRRFGPGTPMSSSEKARRARFLSYRGFSPEHIRAVLGANLASEV